MQFRPADVAMLSGERSAQRSSGVTVTVRWIPLNPSAEAADIVVVRAGWGESTVNVDGPA
jgi:hypothetical protein